MRSMGGQNRTIAKPAACRQVYDSNGRGERTQTFDLTVPNRARYQLRHTPIDVQSYYILFCEFFLVVI